MSPQSALAQSLVEGAQVEPVQAEAVQVEAVHFEPEGSDRTPAATIVFDRLPIASVPAFPSATPIRALRLVSSHTSSSAPAGARPVALSLPAEVPAPNRQLRLTARGRFALAVVAALLFSGFALLAHSLAAPTTAVSPSLTGARASVVVQPGDTLWSIATGAAPTADPRATIQRIVDLNRLSGTALYAGEQLRLPS
jgi:LysM repeat protein